MEQYDYDEKMEEDNKEFERDEINSSNLADNILQVINSKIENDEIVKELESYLNNLPIDCCKMKYIIEFTNAIDRVSSMSSHKEILNFLENLNLVKITKHPTRSVLTESIVKFFKKSKNMSSVDEDIKILLLKNLLNGGICDIKKLKESKVKKILEAVEKSLKELKSERYEEKLLKLL